MSTFKYPSNDFDNADKLLLMLGSFWATTYQDSSLLSGLASTAGQLAQQTHLQLMELVRGVSRYTVPIFHQENWYGLTILESKINTDVSLIEKYQTGSSEAYSSTANLTYGAAGQQTLYSVTKPDDLKDVKVIFNRLTEPSVELTNGMDFWVEDEVIILRENPFKNDRIAKREILNSEGKVQDRECVLWLYRGQWDWETVYEQFGYALRLKMESSKGYRDFINAIFDSFVAGTCVRTQQQALAASFGVPLVVEAEETVVDVVKDSKRLSIITDAHVYQFPLRTTAIVSKGDKVSAGDPLTDLFQVFELNRGTNVEETDLAAIATGPGVLSYGFWGDITWSNEETPIKVKGLVDGYTFVSWDLGGFPFDVEKFWDDVHAKGVAEDNTLAMMLDKRENPIGQPKSDSLPATINPLQFLLNNLLRNNAYVVKVKPGSQLTNQLSFVPAVQLRKIQPPHTLMILVVELAYADPTVIMEGPGTKLSPGYTENVTGFPCMVLSETIDPDDYVTERIQASQIGGRCI